MRAVNRGKNVFKHHNLSPLMLKNNMIKKNHQWKIIML
jgi:hypothetical protein